MGQEACRRLLISRILLTWLRSASGKLMPVQERFKGLFVTQLAAIDSAGKTLVKLSLGTSEGTTKRLLHDLESWCVSLVDAARTGTEAIEVAISAGSRPN